MGIFPNCTLYVKLLLKMHLLFYDWKKCMLIFKYILAVEISIRYNDSL